MSDKRIRELEKAAAGGDTDAAAELERVRSRSFQDPMTAYFSKFIGKEIYIEGARMNYLGKLLGVAQAPDGQPTGLLMSPIQRVGDWSRTGPDHEHVMEMPSSEELPGLIPTAAIDQFSEAPKGWLRPVENNFG